VEATLILLLEGRSGCWEVRHRRCLAHRPFRPDLYAFSRSSSEGPSWHSWAL